MTEKTSPLLNSSVVEWFYEQIAARIQGGYSHPSAPNIPRQKVVDAADAVEKFLELVRKK